jgi:hypothetical protein
MGWRRSSSSRIEAGGISFVAPKPAARQVEPTTVAPQCSIQPLRLAKVEPRVTTSSRINTRARWHDAGERRLAQEASGGRGGGMGNFVGLKDVVDYLFV